MIVGVGIDAVDIHRFTTWHTYPYTKLRRIFSDEEITYCLKIPRKTAERFAVRFATREAFYKAFSSAQPYHDIPFLTICRALEVSFNLKRPLLQVQWNLLKTSTLKSSLSLTHTPTTAIAVIILETL